MSEWYDPVAGRYRTSLPYKIFYLWGWQPSRWVMFRLMSSEQAHYFGIHVAIPIVGRVERVWQVIVNYCGTHLSSATSSAV